MSAAAKGDEQAKLAIDVFCYRIKKYIGAYSAALGHVDGLVFTGGIGKTRPPSAHRHAPASVNSELRSTPPATRQLLARKVEISTDNSRVRVMVIPTNEELLIARDTFRVVRGLPNPH